MCEVTGLSACLSQHGHGRARAHWSQAQRPGCYCWVVGGAMAPLGTAWTLHTPHKHRSKPHRTEHTEAQRGSPNPEDGSQGSDPGGRPQSPLHLAVSPGGTRLLERAGPGNSGSTCRNMPAKSSSGPSART